MASFANANGMLLQVKNLRKYYPVKKGVFARVSEYVKAVDDVSFELKRGETLGLVGESGCGKTTTGRTILRLIEPTSGEAFFNGTPLFQLHGEDLRKVRKNMQIIFQDPYGSLNPRMTVGGIVTEGMLAHGLYSRSERIERAQQLLERVGLEREHYYRYPHEFSGGQRQRIGIARALAIQPEFIVCDEPVSALDVSILMEAVLVHENVSKAEARNRTVEMLKRVKIPYAETLLGQYPHQISGGMRQRVMIAMALVCRPKLVIADEPTTALDVTIQAQILELLRELQQEFGMSILMITHDLGIVSDLADAVAVMYAGQIVEYASTVDLFSSPKHPYTLGLFHSRPQLGKRKARLDVIPGSVPSPIKFPPGCRFHPRCGYVAEECRETPVSLELIAEHHTSRCLRVQKREIELVKT